MYFLIYYNNYIRFFKENQIFFNGSPAGTRTQISALRRLPVLETGVLTFTPRGSIEGNYFPLIALLMSIQSSSTTASSQCMLCAAALETT